MKTLYSALYADSCYPFNALCRNRDSAHDPDDLKEGDSALIIWGGSDINPGYYNHPLHRTTHPGGRRDQMEWALLQRAIERGIPIIGVCRGAQMLCAAAGGFLIQDVHNHLGHHTVVTNKGTSFEVNSIHHQMMCWEGTGIDAELLAWCPTRRSTHGDKPYYGYRSNEQFVPPEDWVEPEFVYFPKINGYAVQWHPEGMSGESEASQFVLKTIQEKEAARGSYAEITIPLHH